eukprot:169217-Rhodomonas_salina.3
MSVTALYVSAGCKSVDAAFIHASIHAKDVSMTGQSASINDSTASANGSSTSGNRVTASTGASFRGKKRAAPRSVSVPGSSIRDVSTGDRILDTRYCIASGVHSQIKQSEQCKRADSDDSSAGGFVLRKTKRRSIAGMLYQRH